MIFKLVYSIVRSSIVVTLDSAVMAGMGSADLLVTVCEDNEVLSRD